MYFLIVIDRILLDAFLKSKNKNGSSASELELRKRKEKKIFFVEKSIKGPRYCISYELFSFFG
jgi:hypothetical protein